METCSKRENINSSQANKTNMVPCRFIIQPDENPCETEDGEDVQYICTISKTSTPVAVIRIAPPAAKPQEISSKQHDQEAPLKKQLYSSQFLKIKEKLTFTCYLCENKYELVKDYKEHLAQHIARMHQESYKCSICHKVFDEKVKFDSHLSTTSMDIPQYECIHCGKTFLSKIGVIRHMKAHPAEKKTLINKRSGLMSHQRHHSEKDLLKCRICIKSLTRRHHSTSHTEFHVFTQLHRYANSLRLTAMHLKHLVDKALNSSSDNNNFKNS